MFDELSPELLEKAKACKSTDELEALAEEEGIELSEDTLNAVAGGWYWDKCPELDSCDSYCEVYVTSENNCTWVGMRDLSTPAHCVKVS